MMKPGNGNNNDGAASGNGQQSSAAYEEFLKWKNSMAGKNVSDHTNTTIIKSDVIDGTQSGYTQDAKLLPQNPEEEAAIIEQMKYQPKGLGKGGNLNKNYSYSALKDFSGKQRQMQQQMAAGVEPWCGPPNGPRPSSAAEYGGGGGPMQSVTGQRHNRATGNNIANHLEAARTGIPPPTYRGNGRGRGRGRGGYQNYNPQGRGGGGGYGGHNGYGGGETGPPMSFNGDNQPQQQDGAGGYQQPPWQGKQSRQKAFVADWKKKKQEDQTATNDEKIVLRDPKAKLITFEIISINRFAITQNFMMPEEIVQILKKYGGAYNFEQREWIVGLQKYKEVAIEISQFCRQKIIDLDPITQMAFDIIEYKIPFSDDSKKNLVGYDYRNDLVSGLKPSLKDLPASLFHSLYNFQKVGVQYGIDNHGRCVLGDEMGVGKTIQAISIAYLYQRDWPVLIVTPSSLKFSWRDELLTWIQHLRPDQIQVFAKSTEDFDPNCCIYIMSYVLATKLAAFIVKKNFKICICDEAHYLKSRDSQRSRYLVPLLIKMKRILLLSGTPMLARPNELYNLVRILRPDVFYSFKEFGLRYCNPRESYFGVDWTGSSNMRELHLVLEKGIMIRRLKSEVLTELPAKRRQKIVVATDAHVVRKISMMLKRVKNWDEKIQNTAQGTDGILQCIADDFEGFVSNTDVQDDPTLNAIDDKYNHIINAYQLTGTAKVKGCVEFLETLIENKMKFIVFAHHYEVMDAIEDSIVKKKISYIRVDGQIDSGKRYEAVRKFQNDPNCLVGILALTASSQGITLTAASTVVFAEMNWTPGIMVQAEDRCHRIGQNKSVNVYYCYGENTVDGMIYPRLKLKSEVFANILDGKQTEFNIENDEDVPLPQDMSEEDRKRLEKEAKLIERTIVQDEANRLQQTNISDFFFGSGMSSSKASTCAGETPIETTEVTTECQTLSQSVRDQVADEYVEYDPEIEYDRPPTPPLASLNVFLEDAEQQDCGEENFDEGTDSKWKTYQNIRRHKKQFYYQQKELQKQKQSMAEMQRTGMQDGSGGNYSGYDPPGYRAQGQYGSGYPGMQGTPTIGGTMTQPDGGPQNQNQVAAPPSYPIDVDEEHPLYKEQMQHQAEEPDHTRGESSCVAGPTTNNNNNNYGGSGGAHTDEINQGAMMDQTQGGAVDQAPIGQGSQQLPPVPYQATQPMQHPAAVQSQAAAAHTFNPTQPHPSQQSQYQQQNSQQFQQHQYQGSQYQQQQQSQYGGGGGGQQSQYSGAPGGGGYHGNGYGGGGKPQWNNQYGGRGGNRNFYRDKGYNKYSKYNDKQEEEALDEYNELQEEILKVEEEFLERLPQEDPFNAMQKTLKLFRTTTEDSVRDCSEAVIKATQQSQSDAQSVAGGAAEQKQEEEKSGKSPVDKTLETQQFILLMQKMILRSEAEIEKNFQPNLDVEEVYLESEIFPAGLPEVVDLDQKKRKTEEEKLAIEAHKNPPNSPFPKDTVTKRSAKERLFPEPKVEFQLGDAKIMMPMSFFRTMKQYQFIHKPMTEDDKKVESMAEQALDQLDDIDEDLNQVFDDAMTLQVEIDKDQASQRPSIVQGESQQPNFDRLQSFYQAKQSQQASQVITVQGSSNGIAVQQKWRPNHHQQSQQARDCGNFFSQAKRKGDLQDHFMPTAKVGTRPANNLAPRQQPKHTSFAVFEQREESSILIQEKSELPPQNSNIEQVGVPVEPSSMHESQMSFASQQTNYIPQSQRAGGGSGRAFKFLGKKKF